MSTVKVFILTILAVFHSCLGQVGFIGQCRTNMPVVKNFNASRYVGTWYLIETYRSQFQNGACIDATYDLEDNGTFTIRNSQVYNRNLQSIVGTAVLDNDGTGKLRVWFPKGRSPSDYWILATDYDSYALVYSCFNRATFLKDVWAWKLSRTRTLTPSAVEAIREVMRTFPVGEVVDDIEFRKVDHSPESCFYFPSPNPNVEVKFRGSCDPNVPVVENFNATQYQGRWHLVESYPSSSQRGTCITAHYEPVSDGINVSNSQILNQQMDTVTGFAVLASDDGRGILNVSFPDAGTSQTNQTPYWVVATDYESYSLVYTCVDLEDGFKKVWSWKLSRTRQLSPFAVEAINNVTREILVLDNRYYFPVDQSMDACFHLPEHRPGMPVILPGQCQDSESLPIERNFNADLYRGRWHLIESYPSSFQEGKCIATHYRPESNHIHILNTQVLDQKLDMRSGLAVAASDNLGLLTVSFPIDGTNETTQTPYWIISTDYVSYALVYSCANVDQENRQVWSWKLSRTRQLTHESRWMINRFIWTIPVLDFRYYEPVDQSREGCFYFPKPEHGVPVVFPGQCENISAVPNFNLTKFAGTWYEIEAYPDNRRQGHCVRHEYKLRPDNMLDLLSSQVMDKYLRVLKGTLSFTSIDGSARLSVTIDDNGSVVTIPFWIVAVDYEDYALAYGCVNVDEDYRRVYSWKLSRYPTLSHEGQEAIDTAMTATDVLDHRYFERIDHTDAACLYYPDFEELPQVITLPGSCDPSIRGVPNFNVSRYMGRWYEIETYPQPGRGGDCIRELYSEAGDLVEVQNTEVLDQVLNSRKGLATADPSGYGLLSVSFDVGGVTTEANYTILATDYEDFALVYNCRDLGNGSKQVFSRKLSRNRTLSAHAHSVIDGVMSNHHVLRQSYFMPTNQTQEACFYVPELVHDQEVRLRGSCGDIIGQTDFDLEKYLGWWHDVSSYPIGTGTCSSIRYEQEGGQVTFVETHVSGLSATVTKGTVEAVGEGKLKKTWMNSTRLDQYIWVLGTDYKSYSVVFSCKPDVEDDEYIKVWSAVQSQTLHLTLEAQQSIAQIIADNDYLFENFYLPVNQSKEACFHYPERVSERVVLRGQCDPDISGQENFNMHEFARVWYQIERYPYPEVSESSACIGTRYTFQEGTDLVDVTKWKVKDDKLQIIEGQAILNASSAELEVTFPSAANGQSTASLRVLTTDYTSYALVYTCKNVNQFERAVGAFKLSRTRTLPASAAAAIASLMGSLQELHQEYFISVTQSDDCLQPNSSALIRSNTIVLLIAILLRYLA